ncbi:TetR family transcriptional regulator, partial [Tepidiforma sp.]|uniref:TetR family transcriptional regulator n=1 Tax=Tepidiforma sp. TaxID=2682230 RepID=UPI0034E001C7
MARDEAKGGTILRGSDRTRARILEAAMEAFARHGFDGTSVRSIAARCGLSDA